MQKRHHAETAKIAIAAAVAVATAEVNNKSYYLLCYIHQHFQQQERKNPKYLTTNIAATNAVSQQKWKL